MKLILLRLHTCAFFYKIYIFRDIKHEAYWGTFTKKKKKSRFETKPVTYCVTKYQSSNPTATSPYRGSPNTAVF